MALYARLLGADDAGVRVDFKIPIHGFSATIAEFARGRLTGAQAQQAVGVMSGAPLDPGEVTEAQTLLGTITGTGTAKLARTKEIDDVLVLGEHQAPGYITPTEVQARLGV